MGRKVPDYEKLVERFEEAVRAHAFKGAQFPAEHYYIEKEYGDSKNELLKYLKEVA